MRNDSEVRFPPLTRDKADLVIACMEYTQAQKGPPFSTAIGWVLDLLRTALEEGTLEREKDEIRVQELEARIKELQAQNSELQLKLLDEH